MPGLAHPRNDQFSSNAASANGFWSKHRDDVSYNQLQKFWSDLTVQARQELLKIDKQTLFEQARKNMYCSRCNGLLLEGFLQIVMYGKSFQQDGSAAHLSYSVTVASKSQYDGGMCMTNGCKDEIQDPSVHPWGGLTTTRDGSLTLLECYIFAKSLKGLQIVFDSARVRERERELLYPDACGGGGRGWISQGIATYGRGHGMRETCALHTARLPCDTLVDFWSALSEETRQSLLRMKEEDFIERLMYRFDSKRFCRDCRRNVIREFKELKELKRMRREPRCTSCFCVADTAFQYEVSNDSVLADWHQTFADSVGSYHHFEWAVGTGEGKSDILEFENVGLSGSAQVSGLDLGGLNSCFITLRAWKLDGRCTEIFVKAHALKGQQCVHGRLIVGDGFVTITRGDSIRNFFEHAEEAEEEEDDDSMDKDGNDLDGECSRPQKHAKSPELAREFLLDAAIVIFKEQVEKAFREGTARQNAHSIFVCLALKLLEERVHIACKEIITYEKQMKLLEEEEKEKREEEERKERRRAKEREKKLRRKERLKGKEKDTADKESKLDDTDTPSLSNAPKEEESLPSADDDVVGCEDDLICRNGDTTFHVEDDEASAYQYTTSLGADNHFTESTGVDLTDTYDGSGSFTSEQSKHSNGKSKFRKEGQTTDQAFKWSERRRFAVVSENSAVANNRPLPRYHNDNIPDRSTYGSNRQLKPNIQKTNSRSSASKCSEKFHYGNNRVNERYDGHTNPCGCNQMSDYRPNTSTELPVSAVRPGRESSKYMVKSESASDVSKHFYRGSKYNQTEPYIRQGGGGRLKSKAMANKESPLQFRKVWEPLESSQKRYSRSNSESDVTLMESNFKTAEGESSDSTKSSGELCSSEDSGDSTELDSKNPNLKDVDDVPAKESPKATVSEEDVELCRIERRTATTVASSSNSDNCSSCLSEEVDSNAPSSNHGNPESSSTSDSEDTTCHQPERVVAESGISRQVEIDEAKKGSNVVKISHPCADSNGSFSSSMGYKNQAVLPQMQQQQQQQQQQGQNMFLQMLQSPSTMGYYPQNLVSWTPFPPNGLFTHPPNSYVYGGPPLSYGLDGNPGFCVPYDAMPPPHLTAAPLINGSPTFSNPPPYQPMAQMHRQNVGHQVMDAVKREKTVRPSEAPKNDDGSGQKEKKNSGFSLFHFGGPVALSDMTKSNEEAGGISSDECSGKKETAVEEYNLFAASNGMRFSIF